MPTIISSEAAIVGNLLAWMNEVVGTSIVTDDFKHEVVFNSLVDKYGYKEKDAKVLATRVMKLI